MEKYKKSLKSYPFVGGGLFLTKYPIINKNIGFISSEGCIVALVPGICSHLCAPNFVTPNNSTAISNKIPTQYKNGIILKFRLKGKIKTTINANKDKEK